MKFWNDSEGTVDFVFKIDGVPVPVLWSYNEGVTELQRSLGTPGYDALKNYLKGDAYESERDRVDEQIYSTTSESFATQRREYVKKDHYAGQLGDDEKSVFDGEPAFGVVLTNTRSAIDQEISLVDDGPKPIIQMPLWTYLRLA